jgi:hypothetical protein
MKNTALILAFIMCFVSYQGFAGGVRQAVKKNTEAVEEATKAVEASTEAVKAHTSAIEKKNLPGPAPTDRIPVTSKVVEYMLKNEGNSEGLKFYLSNPITLKIYEQKEIEEVEFNNKMVTLNPAAPVIEKIIDFSVNNEGKLNGIGIPPDKGTELKILFSNGKESKTLIFKRNMRQNCYEFHSVDAIDNKTYQTVFSDPPQLYVHGQDKRNTEVRVFPVTYDAQHLRNVDNNPLYSYNIDTGNFDDSHKYTIDNRRTSPSKYIMGESFVTRDGAIAYARRKNPNLNRNDITIIDTYIREADIEGVNFDIAIAQMLYWTSFLTNQTRMGTKNYAGFSSTPGWSGRFNSISDGVRAHIQHLKFYASPGYRPANIIDPRYSVLVNKGYIGRIQTFGQLYRCWSENRYYGQNIENILDDLYRYSRY